MPGDSTFAARSQQYGSSMDPECQWEEELSHAVARMRSGGLSYCDGIREFQRTYVINVLMAFRGQVSMAAEAIGVHRNTFSRMMADLGIDYKSYRPSSWSAR